MKSTRRIIAVAVSALALVGAGSVAHADSIRKAAQPQVSFTPRDDGQASQWGVAPHKSMQWDAVKGKWGLKLDMDQPTNREMDLNDVAAGAYFRVTPSLRVGGAIALDNQNAQNLSKDIQPRQTAPRVRLETTLKF